MVVLRAFIYAIAVFIALGIIAILVAGIMRILYAIVHRREKKESIKSAAETKTVSGEN
jgi:hypothetical protein